MNENSSFRNFQYQISLLYHVEGRIDGTPSSAVCGYAKARRHHWEWLKAKLWPPNLLRLSKDLESDCLSVNLCSIYSKLWPLVSIMKNAHMTVQNKVIKAKK